jgi:hypothetical protein
VPPLLKGIVPVTVLAARFTDPVPNSADVIVELANLVSVTALGARSDPVNVELTIAFSVICFNV